MPCFVLNTATVERALSVDTADDLRVADIALSELIKDARERRNLGLNQAAQLAKVGKDWLSRIESGEIRRPRDQDKLVRLARVLHIEVEDVLAAAGRLTAEQKALAGHEVTVLDAIRMDKRLTADNKRALSDIYRSLVGEGPRR